MKRLKPLLTSFVVGLFDTQMVHANLMNKHNILPNNIPTAIEFMIVKNGANEAQLFFPKTAVPAHLYCYFSPPSNVQYKGTVAHFTSDDSRITFQPGTGPTLAGGGSDVRILTVEAVTNISNMGSITITVDGDIKVNNVTIMCAMQKIK